MLWANVHLPWQTGAMTEYKPPKMIGRKVPFSMRLTLDQHRLAAENASHVGLSMAEYIGALIERDSGRTNKLDNPQETELPLSNTA